MLTRLANVFTATSPCRTVAEAKPKSDVNLLLICTKLVFLYLPW
jgi:hypothetical protein